MLSCQDNDRQITLKNFFVIHQVVTSIKLYDALGDLVQIFMYTFSYGNKSNHSPKSFVKAAQR